MSDFDKEAEREKLREKFEEKEEDRAATEQMSELLLKGATMTNAHCSSCGDPVFRYDGQEFCPTCQKSISREDEHAESDADSRENIQMADPDTETRVQFGGDGETAGRADESQQTADGATAEPTQATAEQPSSEPATEPATQQPPARQPAGEPATRQPAARDSSTRNADSGGDVASELAAAESLLAQTARRFAERASATDNPERAREHIAAAREAAEALDDVQY